MENDDNENYQQASSSNDPVIFQPTVFDSQNGPVLGAIRTTFNLPTQLGENAEITSNRNLKLNNEKKPGPSYNSRALLPEERTYKLESFDKHALMIFNQKEVDGEKPRHGTEKDVDALTRTFKNFRFQVESHDNLTKDAIFGVLADFSSQDFTDYGCVAIAILTHGYSRGMLRAKDQPYSEIDVIQYFKDYSNPTLVSKPKIFIIQACRGSKMSAGVPVFQAGEIPKDLDDSDPYYYLPHESDLLILHSSSPGHVSYRQSLYGSWFIQTLCNKINICSSELDLESIVREVKRAVAIEMKNEVYNQSTLMRQINKQMPVMTTTLIRQLYLHVPNGAQALGETYLDPHMTPLSTQFGQCPCVLEHFTYMRNCLRHFVEENPHDETAQGILDAANAYQDNVRFYTCKDKMCKVISKYLMEKAKDSPFYKYLHFSP